MGVLRITTSASDTVLLKLEGRLVGPWVDELRSSIWRTDGWPDRLEVDVEDLTFADDDGEKALARLHKMGVRFQGRGPYSEYLFERLNIPLHSRQPAVNKSHERSQR